MIDDSLEAWFNEFWLCYPSDLCHKKKGSKANALKIIQRISPDTNMQSRILGNLRELIRFYRLERKAEGKTDRWPMVTTWLNGECWENITDIQSYSDMNEKIEGRKCKCGGDTDIGNECWSCWDSNKRHKYDDELKEQLKSIGLWKTDGESIHEWQMRCRDYCVNRGAMGACLTK